MVFVCQKNVSQKYTCSVRKCIVAYLVGTLFQVELSVSSTLQQRNSLVKFSKVNLIRPRAFAVRALLRIARRRSGPQGASSPSLCLLRLTAVLLLFFSVLADFADALSLLRELAVSHFC